MSSEPLRETYGDQKPPYSYISLAIMAICNAPEKKLLLLDIYNFIRDRFPYYRNNPRRRLKSLQNCLSFNNCFIKIPRPRSVPGRGPYWAVHPAAMNMYDNGTFRRRRKLFRLQAADRDLLENTLASSSAAIADDSSAPLPNLAHQVPIGQSSVQLTGPIADNHSLSADEISSAWSHLMIPPQYTILPPSDHTEGLLNHFNQYGGGGYAALYAAALHHYIQQQSSAAMATEIIGNIFPGFMTSLPPHYMSNQHTTATSVLTQFPELVNLYWLYYL